MNIFYEFLQKSRNNESISTDELQSAQKGPLLKPMMIISNSSLIYLQFDLSITCALINRFHQPMVAFETTDAETCRSILLLFNQKNRVQRVNDDLYSKRTKNFPEPIKTGSVDAKSF